MMDAMELKVNELDEVAGGKNGRPENECIKIMGKGILETGKFAWEAGKTAASLYFNPVGTIIGWFK